MRAFVSERIARRRQRLVYEEHFDAVRRTLRRLGLRGAALDDATQDVFVIAFEREGDFRGDSSWRTWLLGIARRVASHSHRDQRRRALRHAGSNDALPARTVDAPDEALARRDAVRRVDVVLDRLKEPLREVFVLCELEGLTSAEAACALELSPNTVSSRRRAARRGFVHELRKAAGPSLSRREELEELLDRVRVTEPEIAERNRIWLLVLDAGRRIGTASGLVPGAAAAIAVTVWMAHAPGATREDAVESSVAEARRSIVATKLPGRSDTATRRLVRPESPGREPEKRARPVRQSTAPAAHREPTPRAPAATLREEARLLSGAKQSLNEGALDEARRGIEQHETKFPSGALAEERAHIRGLLEVARGQAEKN